MIAWLFYHTFLAAIVLLPVGVWYYRNLKKERIHKKEQEFLEQFKEMIQTMASALNTGYSVENAMKETQKELSELYPKEAVISGELAFMVRQMQLMIPLEQVFEEFAVRVELEDVHNFATVFLAAKKSGGDMTAIIQNTVSRIGDKIEVRREIDTVLSSKRYELNVMTAVPFGMIAYMMFSFPEFMECLYGNLFGIGVMSVCLAIYGGACVLGTKLIEIEV